MDKLNEKAAEWAMKKLEKTALKDAAEILIHHFMLFSDEKITLESKPKQVTEELDETTLHMRQLLKTKLVDMDLSVRALNCLKAADQFQEVVHL